MLDFQLFLKGSKSLTDRLPTPQATESRLSTRYLIGRLWNDSVRHYIGWLVLAVFSMALMAGANAFSAYLMKPIVDDVFVAKNSEMLWPVGLLVISTFIVKDSSIR